VITGDIVYVRFHGTRGRYSGSYPDSQLKNWADWLKQHRKEARAIYCYFNNDYRAYAIGNARTLIEKFGD